MILMATPTCFGMPPALGVVLLNRSDPLWREGQQLKGKLGAVIVNGATDPADDPSVRQCADNITATYSTLPDGQVRVHNACRTRDGKMDDADGVARTTNKAPGALEVRFAPSWLAWLPWVWADYWVLDVDPDYRWAVVGSPSRDYLWVLSRDTHMQRPQFEALRHRAAERGYPIEKLVMSAPLD